MITSMTLLWIVALEQVGGWAALWTQLAAIDPQLINPFPANPRFGVLLYILGWLGAGVGVVGQPHIMVRAMACRSGREIHKARHIYLIWYLIFTAGCYGVALACRVLLPDIGSFDAELALPTLALRLLPGVLVGLVLAGVFSATMSTADSQLLSCSAALTQDLFPRWRYSYRAAKVGTVAITLVVLAIALGGSQNVFALVTMSWSALAAGLGPLLVIRALRLPLGAVSALAVMGSGLLTVFVWSYGLGYSNDVFEVLPGMLVGVLVYLVLRPRASETSSREGA
jgi:sodium/proline symporter